MKGGCERAQRNLYVLNLPLDATTEQFENLFGRYGGVEHAVILATLDHLARRRGFILMSDAAQARAAIRNLNNYDWHHYRIEVSFAIVQRSGALFSERTADTLRDGNSAHPQAIETFDQPLEHRLQQPTRAEHDFDDQRRQEEAMLSLSGLDTSIVSSTAMVRALTEPFGEVIALYHTEQPPCDHEQHDGNGNGGHAVIVYSTHCSAALARLALDGLVIGGSHVQATIAPSFARTRDSMPDIIVGETAASSVYLLGTPADPETGMQPSLPQSSPASGLFRHMAGIPRGHASSVHRRSSGRSQQDVNSGCKTSASAGHNSNNAGEAAINLVHENTALNERRNLPRPIGDERQRAAFTK